MGIGGLTMMNIFVLACLLISISCAGARDLHLTDEIRLTKHLLEKYEKIGTLGRPVAKDSDPWNVTFYISLQNILEVDTESDTIDVVMWHNINWQDHYLNWDKADYNVNNIRVRPSDVIVPDIVLYNAASRAEHISPAHVLVYHGGCMYVQPVRQRFSCRISGRDKFTCDLKFGSWTYSDDKLKLKLGMDHVDLEYYQPNKAWKVVGTKATRNVKHYPGYPEAYVDLTFSLTLKRESDNKL